MATPCIAERAVAERQKEADRAFAPSLLRLTAIHIGTVYFQVESTFGRSQQTEQMVEKKCRNQEMKK